MEDDLKKINWRRPKKKRRRPQNKLIEVDLKKKIKNW
jgi:hypothetical protein